MSAFVDDYDAVFFDLDGVLYLGPVAVLGAVEGVSRLHERDVGTYYVTNNAARSTRVVADHLVELGFDAREEEVVSSAQAAGRLLARELPPGASVLVVGTQNLADHMREAGLVVVESADEGPDAVIQGYDPQLAWPRLDQAGFAVQRGARWFATNTDSSRPTDRGLVPGAGAMVDAVGAAVPGRRPEVIGKPHRPLMEEAMRRSGARRPVFVGDRLDTDILGAATIGIDSFLVFTGAHGVRELCAAPPGGRPTAIGWDVESLFEPRRVAQLDAEGASCRGVRVRAEDNVPVIEGDLGDREHQLDAAWALATLAWDRPGLEVERVCPELGLLP